VWAKEGASQVHHKQTTSTPQATLSTVNNYTSLDTITHTRTRE